MKAFFQLVDRKTGVRSDAVGMDAYEYAQALKRSLSPELLRNSYVLVLVDDATKKNWEFSKAPLMLAKRFIAFAENRDLFKDIQLDEGSANG